jgi:hypothetical protein
MLYRFDVALAQLAEGKFALRPINLALLVPKLSKLTSRDLPIGCFEGAFDFLAVRLNAGIIDATWQVSVKTLVDLLKHADFTLWGFDGTSTYGVQNRCAKEIL